MLTDNKKSMLPVLGILILLATHGAAYYYGYKKPPQVEVKQVETVKKDVITIVKEIEVQTALGATQPALTLNYRDTADNDQTPLLLWCLLLPLPLLVPYFSLAAGYFFNWLLVT